MNVSGWNPIKGMQNILGLRTPGSKTAGTDGLKNLSQTQVANPTPNVAKTSSTPAPAANPATVHSNAASSPNAPATATYLSIGRQILQALGFRGRTNANASPSITTSVSTPAPPTQKKEEVALPNKEQAKLLLEVKAEAGALTKMRFNLYLLNIKLNKLGDSNDPLIGHQKGQLLDEISKDQAAIETAESILTNRVLDNPSLAENMLTSIRDGNHSKVITDVTEHILDNPHLSDKERAVLKEELGLYKGNLTDQQIPKVASALKTTSQRESIESFASVITELSEQKKILVDFKNEKNELTSTKQLSTEDKAKLDYIDFHISLIQSHMGVVELDLIAKMAANPAVASEVLSMANGKPVPADSAKPNVALPHVAAAAINHLLKNPKTTKEEADPLRFELSKIYKSETQPFKDGVIDQMHSLGTGRATISAITMQQYGTSMTPVHGLKRGIENLLPPTSAIASDLKLVGISAGSVRVAAATEKSSYSDKSVINATVTPFGEPGYPDSHIIFNFSDKTYGGVTRDASNMALEEVLMHTSRQLMNLQNSGMIPEQRENKAASGEGESHALAISNVNIDLKIDTSKEIDVGSEKIRFYGEGALKIYNGFVAEAKAAGKATNDAAFSRFLLEKGIVVKKDPPDTKTILNGVAPSLHNRARDKNPNHVSDAEVADLFFAVDAKNKALIEAEAGKGSTTLPGGWFGAGAFSNPGTLVALVEISSAQFSGHDLHFHNFSPGPMQAKRNAQFTEAKEIYETQIKPEMANLTKAELLQKIQLVAQEKKWPLGDYNLQ